jgi:nicotinate-nucleotide pyrophosphorylase (carboxylating)
MRAKKIDYAPVTVDQHLEDDTRQLVRLAIREDLERQVDWTTVALLDPDRQGSCLIVSREVGVACGLAILDWIIDECDADLAWKTSLADGDALAPGTILGEISGSCRDLLTMERTILNFLCHLCGVASTTARYVDALRGASTRLYDTRKTIPGWRRLDKYAVRCGGGHNHRTGLFDGFLIKDNHLALAGSSGLPLLPGDAVRHVLGWRGGQAEHIKAPQMIELEVDSLEQLRHGLLAGPQIILLDNFSIESLREGVKLRDEINPLVELEASGGVTLATLSAIASTGVDRISCGALTHSAHWLDLGMDYC